MLDVWMDTAEGGALMSTTHYIVDREGRRMLNIDKGYWIPDTPRAATPDQLRAWARAEIEEGEREGWGHHPSADRVEDIVAWGQGRPLLVLTEHHEAHDGLPWPICAATEGECCCYHQGACEGWAVERMRFKVEDR